MSDIVDRLKSGTCGQGCGTMTECICATAEDAADEITRLRSERSNLLGTVRFHKEQADALRAKVERLEEAVKDLTAECREYCFDECQSNCEPMTACRLFIARAAITKGEREKRTAAMDALIKADGELL